MYEDFVNEKEFPSWVGWDPREKEINGRKYVLYALDRLSPVFVVGGLPESIPERIAKRILFTGGFALAHKHTDGNMYLYTGGLGGKPDEYHEPSDAVVANPAQNLNETWKIGEDCVLIRNDSYMLGVLPMFNRYARQLVESDLTLYMAGINTRIPFMISAGDDDTEQSARQFLADVESGKLGMVAEQMFFDGVRVQPTGNLSNYVSQQIELQQYIKASWNMEIGLNSNWNGKREAITANESMLNEDALTPFILDMLNNWRDGFNRVNEKYGTNWTVDLNPESPWGQRAMRCAECGDPVDEEVLVDEEAESADNSGNE